MGDVSNQGVPPIKAAFQNKNIFTFNGNIFFAENMTSPQFLASSNCDPILQVEKRGSENM